MILDTVNKKIQLQLTAPKTTNDCAYVVDYVDINQPTTTYSPASANGTTNGTTAVDAVSSPATNYERSVKSLTVRNADTASVTLKVIYNDNGTARIEWQGTLAVGDVLQYTDANGFSVINNAGELKFTTAAASGPVQVSGSISILGTPSVVVSGSVTANPLFKTTAAPAANATGQVVWIANGVSTVVVDGTVPVRVDDGLNVNNFPLDNVGATFPQNCFAVAPVLEMRTQAQPDVTALGAIVWLANPPSAVIASTEVSGTVTILNGASVTARVSGTVTIANGASVTIQNGASVTIQQGASMQAVVSGTVTIANASVVVSGTVNFPYITTTALAPQDTATAVLVLMKGGILNTVVTVANVGVVNTVVSVNTVGTVMQVSNIQNLQTIQTILGTQIVTVVPGLSVSAVVSGTVTVNGNLTALSTINTILGTQIVTVATGGTMSPHSYVQPVVLVVTQTVASAGAMALFTVFTGATAGIAGTSQWPVPNGKIFRVQNLQIVAASSAVLSAARLCVVVGTAGASISITSTAGMAAVLPYALAATAQYQIMGIGNDISAGTTVGIGFAGGTSHSMLGAVIQGILY